MVAAGDTAGRAPAALWPSCAGPTGIPIYAFIRRKGNGPEQALDLTQGYFARLLERGTVAAADPARGRFRSFLLADCRHFLAHERERDAAARRGGRIALLSINATTPKASTSSSRPTSRHPSGSSSATGRWPCSRASWP